MVQPKVIGLRTVQMNLNREITKIKGRSLEGLISGAIIIRRDMDKTAPLIPVDTNNLRASAFITTIKGVVAETDQSGEITDDEVRNDYSRAVGEAQSMVVSTGEPTVVMGFGANYALFVHEMVGANFAGNPERAKRTKKKKYLRRPGAGAKFFEESINRNKDAVLMEVQKHARIRP